MICILSPTEEEAIRFARSHFLSRSEYFWANQPEHLKAHSGFHVFVIGKFDHTGYFERLYALAQDRGSRNRK